VDEASLRLGSDQGSLSNRLPLWLCFRLAAPDLDEVWLKRGLRVPEEALPVSSTNALVIDEGGA